MTSKKIEYNKFVLKNSLNEHPLVPILRAWKKVWQLPQDGQLAKEIFDEFTRVNAILMIQQEFVLIEKGESELSKAQRNFVIGIIANMLAGQKEAMKKLEEQEKGKEDNGSI